MSLPKVYVDGARCPDCGRRYFTNLEAWYRAFRKPLIRQIARMARGRNGIDPEDILHSIFQEIDEEDIVFVAVPGAWLYQVARYKVMGEMRKTVAAPMASDDVGVIIDDGHRSAAWTSISPVPNEEARLDAMEAKRVMAALPNRQKVVSYLALVLEWPQAEIADYLGIASATVAAHLAAARRTIKNQARRRHAVGKRTSPYDFKFEGGMHTVGGTYLVGGPLYTWVWCLHWKREPERWRRG